MLKELIKNIIPYYNKYKENQQNLTGAQALEIIWEVGDLIKEYLKDKDIAPRTLYHQIYGKSEGNTDIVQKSYITRDFLDRAYRVRRIFKNKKEINQTFPALKRYRLFYKSMPFFDEGRFKMSGQDREKLILLLNSNKTYQQIIGEVTKLREKRIALSIPRDSKLKELEQEKKIFINFYNFLYQQFKEKKYTNTKKLLGNVNFEFIDVLSRNTGALVSDDLKLTEFSIPEGLGKELKEFGDLILKLVLPKDAKVRRRFRRLIPSEKMMRLSEMIYAIRNEDAFNKFHL
jgi:ribosomal protein L19E